MIVSKHPASDIPSTHPSLAHELAGSPRARVVRQIRDWIEAGTISTGQPLPSERILAERFGVDRRTVRRALNMLSEEGVLRSNGGRMRLAVAPARESAPPARTMAESPSVLTDAVVLLAPSTDPAPEHRAGGWSNFIIHGAVQAIQTAGLHVLAMHPSRLDRETLERLVAGSPYGVIMPRQNPDDDFEQWAAMLRDHGLNVAIYDDASSVLTSFDRVTSDHEAGAYLLTRWLISQGRRRIVNAWPAPALSHWFAGRRAGYERAMREADLPPLPTILVPLPEGNHASLHARLWAGFLVEHLSGENAVDAILMASDGYIPDIAEACRLCGRIPHRDIAIAGYDNYWSDFPGRNESTMPIATVDKGNEELGAELVRLLIDRCEGRLPQAAQHHVVQPKLIVGSGGGR